MAVISVNALPGKGGRWGQLGSRDPWVSPKPGFQAVIPYPRAQFRAEAYSVPVTRQPAPLYTDGQRKNSMPNQALFRQQVLDIIRIDASQRTPTNFAQFQASATTIPSRAPSVPLRCYLPEPDAPYPTPYQPVKIGRLPPLNGARAGHVNPGLLPAQSVASGVQLRGGAFRKRKKHRINIGRYKRRKYLGTGRTARLSLQPSMGMPSSSASRAQAEAHLQAEAEKAYRQEGDGYGCRSCGGQAYRQPYDGIDDPEVWGSRTWQLDALPEVERSARLPTGPPTWAEEPQMALAPPAVVEHGAYVPSALYVTPAIREEQMYDVWNQPVGFYMPAVTAPDVASSSFATERFINPRSGYFAGSGRNWAPIRERMYEHIKRNYLSRGMSLPRSEELAARTVNKYRASHNEL